MWVNIETDLTLTTPEEDFLASWIKYSDGNKPFEHKKAVVDNATGLPILLGSPFHYECSYNEIKHESSLYDHLYLQEDTAYTFAELYKLDMGSYSCKEVPVYGVTDYDKEDDAANCVLTLIENYPELKLLGNLPNRKFMICICTVSDDFRFHKNGGYRGKDEVAEHVYDSPADEYLMFNVIELVGE